MTIAYRRATLADLDFIKAIEDACFLPLGINEARATIKNRILACPAGCLVAVQDGTIIGFSTAEQRRRITKFSLDYDARRTHSSTGRYLYLSALAVDPQHQGNGVGTELLTRQIALAKKLGCEAIVTSTAPARKYYERFGFTVVKKLYQGKAVDYYVLARYL